MGLRRATTGDLRSSGIPVSSGHRAGSELRPSLCAPGPHVMDHGGVPMGRAVRRRTRWMRRVGEDSGTTGAGRPEALGIAAYIIALPGGELTEGIALLDRALEHNPNSADSL